MRKILILFSLILSLCLPTLVAAQAQPAPSTTSTANEQPSSFTRTILPEVNKAEFNSNSACRYMITKFEDIYFYKVQTASELGSISRFDQAITQLKSVSDTFLGVNFKNVTRNDVLGCALVTGRIKMFYLSMFIAYALNMIAIISGSISMLFIILGGYKYVIGSLTQSTDDAKKTIINSIIGLLVSTGAWIIVNVVLAIISS